MSRLPAAAVVAVLILAVALAPYAVVALKARRQRRRSDG
jgi:hypothetical protein